MTPLWGHPPSLQTQLHALARRPQAGSNPAARLALALGGLRRALLLLLQLKQARAQQRKRALLVLALAALLRAEDADACRRGARRGVLG